MNGNRQPQRSWLPTALQALALMGFWLLLSGIYDPFHVALGGVSVALVLLLNSRQTSEVGPVQAGQSPRWGRIFLYLPWLLIKMVLSGLHVARVILTPRMPLDPGLIRFKSAQPNDVARVVLGNSITLTPGTLTVDIGKEEYLVHALTRATAKGLLDTSMQTRVARLFVDDPKEMVFDRRIVQSRTPERESDT